MGLRAVGGLTFRVVCAVGLGFAIAIASVAARAAPAPPRSAKLTYTRGAGASDCPDVEVVRAGVAARLGYEPFDDGAKLLVTATVNRSGHTLEARIQIGGAGPTTAERKLTSRQSDCSELSSAMELAISIAIDPLAGSRPRAEAPRPPPAAPAPPPAPAPAPPPPQQPVVIVVQEPPPPPPPPKASAPIGFQARLGGIGTVGSAPAPALGATVQGSARRGAFSIGLEGRGDLASTTALYRGDVHVGDMNAWLLMGSLVPCAFRSVLEGCALLSGGVIRASATNLTMSREVSAPLLAFGARVGVEIPLGGVLSAGVHLDVLARITETVLQIGGETVWTSPPVSAALGATVGARFP